MEMAYEECQGEKGSRQKVEVGADGGGEREDAGWEGSLRKGFQIE